MTVQDRIADEKKELDIKIEALNEFINGEDFQRLDMKTTLILQMQLCVMEEYSDILRKRLDTFHDE